MFLVLRRLIRSLIVKSRKVRMKTQVLVLTPLNMYVSFEKLMKKFLIHSKLRLAGFVPLRLAPLFLSLLHILKILAQAPTSNR